MAALGRIDAARTAYERSLKLAPNWPQAADSEAWRLATDANPENRNGAMAIHLAAEACEATGSSSARYLDTLGAACAEAGRFDDAQQFAAKALALASASENAESRKAIENRLQLYRERRPFREAPSKR